MKHRPPWLISSLAIVVATAGRAQDVFEAWPSGSAAPTGGCAGACTAASGLCPMPILVVGGSLVAAALAALLLRTRGGRRMRPFFLLGSLALLGFGMGACPCPMRGLVNGVLGCTSAISVEWLPVAWLAGLAILTLFSGATWCGWVCHMGALQEFLYRKELLSPLGPRVLAALSWVRRAAAVALVAAIGIAGVNIWEPLDPFRAVFNLNVSGILAGTAVAGLLIGSVLVYRPFCRTLCPVGLILGWVGRLPFAAGPRRARAECSECGRCATVCPTGALRRGTDPEPERCIACGACLDACRPGVFRWQSGIVHQPFHSHPKKEASS